MSKGLPSAPFPRVDTWVWGNEQIIWGFDPSHAYTVKVLEPYKGRIGCLSLQYHQHKSETWISWKGTAWALIVLDGEVCTRLLRPGDIQNITPPTIHRLMAVSDDVQILEPSTPDVHAADKSVPKDVIRLHCVHGRQVSAARDPIEANVIARCIELTEEAIACVERGDLPPEYHRDLLAGKGAFQLAAPRKR